DCGEGTQRQLKIAGINPCKITRILITHWHGDHVLGLPGLIQTLALSNYSKTLHIYGPKGTKKFFSLLLSTFVFKEKLKTEIHELLHEGKFLETPDFYIEAHFMKHFTPCLAYNFVEKNKYKIKINKIKKLGIKPGPVLKHLQEGKNITYQGKKIKAKDVTILKKGRKISFITDTLYNEKCIKAAKCADLLVSEATFLSKEHANKALERGHLTAHQAATIAKKAKVKKLILLHLSQRYAKKEHLVLEEAKKTFKNTLLAKDFMKISI
ncbi:MAG: ribonuclease Z, partial [Candidatus Pacearchaeota archaeon]|nr:ribonuclease Z [Candidatus Pacearchaeota archaeon]